MARNTRSVLTRSARIASSTPGYCTFTATAKAGARHGPVHLADRRRRDRLRVPLREHALGVGAELGAHDLRGQLGRHRRRVLSAARRARRAPVRAGRRRDSSTICPIFISAPFISPRAVATSAAVRSWCSASRSARRVCGRGRPPHAVNCVARARARADRREPGVAGADRGADEARLAGAGGGRSRPPTAAAETAHHDDSGPLPRTWRP